MARLEALGALAGMGPSATRSQVVSALRVVIHMRRDAGARVVDSIGVITGDAQSLRVVPALARDTGGYRPRDGHALLQHLLDGQGE